MQIIKVKIGVPGLQKSIEAIFSFDRCRRDLVLECLNTNLHKLLEKVIV